jgi:hypothetical protein
MCRFQSPRDINHLLKARRYFRSCACLIHILFVTRLMELEEHRQSGTFPSLRSQDGADIPFSFRRMILLLMLFWNMLWELLDVRMVCPSLLSSRSSLSLLRLPCRSNDVLLPTRLSARRCSRRYFVPMLKENYLGWSGIRPRYAVIDKCSSTSASSPHSLFMDAPVPSRTSLPSVTPLP